MEEVGFSYNQLQQQTALGFSGKACADTSTVGAMASSGAAATSSTTESYCAAGPGTTAAKFAMSPFLLAANVKGVGVGAARGYVAACPPDLQEAQPPSFEFPLSSTTTMYKLNRDNVHPNVNENYVQQQNQQLSSSSFAPIFPNWIHEQQQAATGRLLPPDANALMMKTKNWSAISSSGGKSLDNVNVMQQQKQYHQSGSFGGAPMHALNAAGSLVLDSSRGELVNALQMTPKEILEAKALAASKSHSEAERRRRERINSHLATLRSILPTSIKTDKASLLAEVIDHVKMLKRQVAEVYEYSNASGSSNYCTMPTESNEVKVEKEEWTSSPSSWTSSSRRKNSKQVRLRASLCCEDRPDLMAELKQTLEALKLQTVKAEMATMGGRIKNVLTVAFLKSESCKEEETGAEAEAEEEDAEVLMKRLEEELKAVMERGGTGANIRIPSSSKLSKRHRLSSSIMEST